jgi:hypothetical protein
MPTIAKNNDVITVIFSFAVEPERQQELIDMMIDALETTTKHRLDNFEALLKELKYESVREFWKGLAENEFHLHEVVFTEPPE